MVWAAWGVLPCQCPAGGHRTAKHQLWRLLLGARRATVARSDGRSAPATLQDAFAPRAGDGARMHGPARLHRPLGQQTGQDTVTDHRRNFARRREGQRRPGGAPDVGSRLGGSLKFRHVLSICSALGPVKETPRALAKRWSLDCDSRSELCWAEMGAHVRPAVVEGGEGKQATPQEASRAGRAETPAAALTAPSVAAVLGLQRSAGNRITASVLARDRLGASLARSVRSPMRLCQLLHPQSERRPRRAGLARAPTSCPRAFRARGRCEWLPRAPAGRASHFTHAWPAAPATSRGGCG